MSDARADCFNPHTHEGCDLSEERVLLVLKRFNPHTHEGCDIFLTTLNSLSVMFQSTHPRRVWLLLPYADIEIVDVSIHTPTKGVTSLNFQAMYFLMFQSTHPRRVWLLDGSHYWNSCNVSIHTPTKGVTKVCNLFVTTFLCFNPHTHEGCDALTYGYAPRYAVSIHTPTKGVTTAAFGGAPFRLFQSTHPRRVWLTIAKQLQQLSSFNPHTHEGCD